jgi:tRNA(fMet)-specific endonuclease VapC
MTYLLDTDTCVFWLRGRPSVYEHLQAVGPEAVALSIMTVAELRYGAECSDRVSSNHNAIDDFIAPLSVLDIDLETARAFGKVKAELRRSGALIEDIDLLIAATACSHDLILVTNNQDHFGRVPGLRLDNWIQSES